jgi:protein-L-isoaspartate(D-aspartate) O-methyltransferase
MRGNTGEERSNERLAMVRELAAEFEDTAYRTGVASLDPVLRAVLEHVPRHRFVPRELAAYAYENRPLPIGYGQTISQPFIVAIMTQLARLDRDSVVLELGTGSGYQAAVLASLAGRVYSIEIVPELAETAASCLASLRITNVEVRCGDGADGWAEHAPYDAILVTAAAKDVPSPLLEQLAIGGRLVMPVGPPGFGQDLTLMEKKADGLIESFHELPVAFVPLTH